MGLKEVVVWRRVKRVATVVAFIVIVIVSVYVSMMYVVDLKFYEEKGQVVVGKCVDFVQFLKKARAAFG